MSTRVETDTLVVEGIEFKVHYYYDDNCPSPLEGDEGIVISYRPTSRYVLGTKRVGDEEDAEIREGLRRGSLIGWPVYAYVHGGVALSASNGNPFPDAQFDSGRSGWIYCSKSFAIEQWGNGKKRLSAKAKARTLDYLRATADEFSDWLGGFCYRYALVRAAGDGEDDPDDDLDAIDEASGYIGSAGLDEARKDAQAAAERAARRILERRRLAWLGALHEAREKRYWAYRDVRTQL
jgi:hypothetical protein